MTDKTTELTDTFRSHALEHIHRKLSRALEEHPIHDDLMSEQVNINAWPAVVSSFELLELVLKTMVQTRDSEYSRRQMKDDGHNLTTIFRRLMDTPAGITDTKRLETGFAAWRSLHNNFPFCSLECFVEGIKSDYLRWRYYPLEGWASGTPEKNSPHAMLEVALHAIHIVQGSVGPIDHGLQTVGKRMHFTILKSLEKHLIDSALRSEGEDFSNYANDWIKEGGGLVNGVSSAIRAIRGENRIADDWNAAPQFRGVIRALVDELCDPKRTFHWAGTHNVRTYCARAISDSSPLFWTGTKFVNE